jgi:hypothetical protein
MGAWRRYHRYLSAMIAVCLFVSMNVSCREAPFTGPPDSSIPLGFSLRSGDSFFYNDWLLDRDGFRIERTKTRSSWSVRDTALTLHGFSNVTLVVESLFVQSSVGGDSLATIDSLYFSTGSTGDVYQWGFITKLLLRRESSPPAPEWNLIVSPSRGSSTDWVVGPVDSSRVLQARFAPHRDIIGVVIDDVPRAILSYSIGFSSSSLRLTIWLSDAPSAMLRLREESADTIRGMFREITRLHTSASGG